MSDTTDTGESATILVVDDDDSVRRLIVALLERADYSTMQARNALEAMTLLAHQLPDLIITDIFMPEGDGFEIINKMRGTSSVVGIIVVSGGLSGASIDFLKLAGDLGADAVLTKPFREKELLDAVGKVLKRPLTEDLCHAPSDKARGSNCGRNN